VKLCPPSNNETYQDRLLRLEGDKESLVLQVSVLTDQVEAQGDKIRDLESSLKEHRQKLMSTEEMLQQELMSRTSLETQKLDLMDEVSYLKLKLVSMDETTVNGTTSPTLETGDANAKNNKAEDLLQEVKKLKSRVDELEAEKSQYERKLRVTKAEISDLQQLVASKDAEIECLQTQLLARGGSANDSADRDHEYQRLKVGMETLLASNDEKDRRIEELTLLLAQYRKMREIMGLTLGNSEEELSCSPKLRAITHKAHSDIIRSGMSSRGSSPLMLSSSPYQRDLENRYDQKQTSRILRDLWSGAGQSITEKITILCGRRSETENSNTHMELNKYQTLPGKLSKKKAQNRTTEDDGEYLSPVQLSPVHNHDQSYTPIYKSGVCFFLVPGRSDKLDECLLSDQSPLSSGVDSGQQSPVSPENRKTHRGIRKLWGKIRRSQSGSPVPVHDSDMGDFKRGGFRATAGPRLARPTNARELRGPFSKWTVEQVCDWLEDIGLGQYSSSARHWGSNGQTLLSASSQEIEKELSIKNPLHRKKLQLAIRSFSGKRQEKSSDLDYIWVTRWLDDIGLPQYKDQFNEARVDGHMLQYLTVNDLLFLKVTSQLHHLSIKCAIHVLHVNKFNPNCLKRRPSNESQFTPSEVVQWSNHRVMEWLRSVDLAEYAPNLRGSGVHGGLIMLEPRFSSDTLAMLLNIPPQKTLLRRHLNTNFNSLVGPQAQQEKREYTEAPGYTPLSITAKVK
ncbi:hypothetical protein NL108_003155, partial [Boleophthalmus pectinirostris]